MKGLPRLFSETERQIVETTVREVCEIRRWLIPAVNCRTNHVHAVISAPDLSPERVLNQLKSWCSRRLNEALRNENTERWWTRHGSTRYLWKQEDVEAAVEYVLTCQ